MLWRVSGYVRELSATVSYDAHILTRFSYEPHAKCNPSKPSMSYAASNTAWELPALVVAASVRRTASAHRKYRFFAISRDPGQPITRSETLLRTRNFEFISVPIPEAVWDSTPVGHAGTRDANIRLRLHDILPAVGRVVYLDTDVVVNRDIGELFDLIGDERPVTAVQDLGVLMMMDDARRRGARHVVIDEFAKGDLDPDAYFNSGVMAFDLSSLDTRLRMEEALRLASQPDPGLFFDQHALNVAFSGETRFVDNRWNWAGVSLVEHLHCSDELTAAVDACRRDPWIVHYAGHSKPWQTWHRPTEADKYWWVAARSSPFYFRILREFRAELRWNRRIMDKRPRGIGNAFRSASSAVRSLLTAGF